MEIRLLGPMEVRARSGVLVPVTSPKQRVVLAALALRVRQVVSAEELVDCLWGQNPPVTARDTVHSHVMRLRKVLPAPEDERLVTRAPGYLLDVEPDDVDVHRARALRRLAVEATEREDLSGAATLLNQALGLSRGSLLADVKSELLRSQHVRAWEDVLTQLTESRMDTGLALGHHAELLSELRSLVAAYPLSERFRGQLMTALNASGQLAEALQEYREARRVLLDELGVEPGPYLRRTHQEILAAGALSDAGPSRQPVPSRPAVSAEGGVPAELPHTIRGFVGRQSDLARLDALVDGAEHEQAGSALIATIEGMGGVGKTALAIQWAHRRRNRFPDGQLYLNLRGFGPGETPMQPVEALPRLLHSVGVPPEAVPVTVDEQSARLRSLLADRRMLLLLDNARGADQIRPLLPSNPHCLVIVTSRNRLTGLVTRDHATPIRLGPFSPAESADLLTDYLGVLRIREQQATANALADYCGHIPLALGIIAARAMENPYLPLADLMAELPSGHRLDAFEISDSTEVNLRAVLSWSYRALSPGAAELFRKLALHPGQTLSIPGAAAAIGVPVTRAGVLLAELTRANLLDQYSADRFQFHDLLRSYATELVAADVDPDQLLVRRRVLDWYLHTTVATERWLRPHRPPFELVEPAAPVTPTTFTDNADALRWSETERVNLVASIDCAASAGLHEHAWQLALSLSSFWYVSKRRQEWIVTSEIALRSARALGDGKAEGAILASLGAACRESRHYDEAIGHLRRALALHRATGDREREPATLNSLAVAYAESQRFEPAIAALTKAMSLHRERGNANGEALALMNIAVFHHDIGRLDQSVAYNHQALAVFRQLGDRYNAGICLANLGEVYAKLTQHERAVHCYQQAIEMHVSVGNEHGRARTLLYFGRSLCRLGQESRAHECWRTALAVFEELGEPEAEETKELLSQIGNQPAERSKPNPG